MFRCQDVSEKISQSMDMPLPIRQRIAIRVHLFMCRYCSRFHRQLLALRKICRTEAPAHPSLETSATLSAATKARMKEKIRFQ
jgi:hypothetical protein